MKPESLAKDFPVVCVGGSAGGLDAYIRLLRHLAPDIVVVNHMRTIATRYSSSRKIGTYTFSMESSV
jgi:chemotaxis response regulator CheB